MATGDLGRIDVDALLAEMDAERDAETDQPVTHPGWYLIAEHYSFSLVTKEGIESSKLHLELPPVFGAFYYPDLSIEIRDCSRYIAFINFNRRHGRAYHLFAFHRTLNSEIVFPYLPRNLSESDPQTLEEYTAQAEEYHIPSDELPGIIDRWGFVLERPRASGQVSALLRQQEELMEELLDNPFNEELQERIISYAEDYADICCGSNEFYKGSYDKAVFAMHEFADLPDFSSLPALVQEAAFNFAHAQLNESAIRNLRGVTFQYHKQCMLRSLKNEAYMEGRGDTVDWKF